MDEMACVQRRLTILRVSGHRLNAFAHSPGQGNGPMSPRSSVVSPREAARLAVVLSAVVFKGPGQGFRLSPITARMIYR